MDLSVLSLCEPCYTNGCCGINEDAHINRRRLTYMHSDLRRSDVHQFIPNIRTPIYRNFETSNK